MDESIEIIDNALVQAVKLRSLAGFKLGISLDGAKKARRKRRIYALEELQEHETDRITMGQELIPAGAGELGDQPFGP